MPSRQLRVAMLLHKSVVHDSRVRREAEALVEAGHDVTVLELAAVDSDRLDGYARRSVLPPAWVKRRIPFALYRLAFFATFVRGILAVRPDVVHAHDAAMLLPGLVGSRLTGAKLVYDSHELATSVPYRERTWALFVEAIERLAVPRAVAVITVSDSIADRLRERYRLSHRPVVVRNVTDLELDPDQQAGLREAVGADSAPLVLHQGAAAPDRGCETLVRSLAHLPDPVRLVFLGDGEPGFDARLRTLADDLGVGDRVTILPSVPLDRLLAHTREADLGVTLLEDTCENHRLALPNKLFEYVAAGVPVVASDFPEMGRVVRDYGIGWTTDPADPAGVAAAISDGLAQRGDEELAERLRRAAAELRWPVERGRLVELYERL